MHWRKGKIIPEAQKATETSDVQGDTPGGITLRHIGLGVVLLLLVAVVVIYFWKPTQTPLDRAVDLIHSNKSAAALPILQQLETEQNPDVYPWLAQAYLDTDNFPMGRTALDTAVKLHQPCEVMAPVVLAYARRYQSVGDFAEAEKVFVSAEDVCKEKNNQLTEGKARMYFAWSEQEALAGKIKEAIAHLQIAQNDLPSLQQVDDLKNQIPHRMAEYYRQLAANAEIQEHDEKRAVAYLEMSLTASDEPLTRMLLGNIYKRLNDIPKAIEHYRRVAQMDQNNLEARHYLVELSMKTNDLAGAHDALLELTEREKSIENFELLANLAIKLGNYASAVRALEEASNLREKDLLILARLEKILLEWSDQLQREGKNDEAFSVKGHAERVKDMIKEIQLAAAKDKNKATEKGADAPTVWSPDAPPVSLLSSRIVLPRGSLTPEGEIRVKNVSGQPQEAVPLTFVFYDNTTKRRLGSVTASAPAMGPGSMRSIYFSSPNIVKTDHRLAVIIFWKGRLIKELPILKEH